MDRHEQLKFCRVCNNRIFDPSRGLLCGLTNKPAEFENDCPDFSGDRDKIWQLELAEHEVKKNRFLALFIPGKNYFFTPLIADLCILIFIIMLFNGGGFLKPDLQVLLNWGADYKPLTLEGQYWRLITNCFLHAEILHLLGNIFALLFIGLLLEPFIGKTKFLVAFFITGLSGSVVSMWWHNIDISVGASGAIFGLFGVYISLLLLSKEGKKRKSTLLPTILVFVIFGLISGFRAGIDNAAHFGGLASGLVYGAAIYPKFDYPFRTLLNNISHFGSLSLIFAAWTVILVTTKNPGAEYNRIMKEFWTDDQKALFFFRIPDYSPDDQLLKAIRDQGLPNWHKCANLVEKLDSIPDLPEVMKGRIYLLRKYCDYRITSYNLIEKSIQSKSFEYDLEIKDYNQKISLIQRKYGGENIPDSLLEVKPSDYTVPKVPDNYLLVIDDKIVDKNTPINPGVVSFQVLDGPTATLIYGKKGKNGALVITTNKYYKEKYMRK